MAADRELLLKLREIEKLVIRSIAGYFALKIELDHKRKPHAPVTS